MVAQAHQLGLVVMPYLDISWWNLKSRTMQSLERPADVAVQNRLGQPRLEKYPGDHDGYVVSPYVPVVRDQLARMMDEWRTEVPADCVFFDQIGARPWVRDFNPAAPTPISYADGWLAALAPYSSRCVMVEDGWDRLAQTSVGFHGSGLMMMREHDSLNDYFGPGNWQPYPLADWLFHDKVLVYQHDLSPTTMTDDPEVLLWNAAFGYVLSYSWSGLENTLYSPWLDLVGSFQRTLGPLYAGRPLTGYRTLAPNATESDFGDYSVVANWSATTSYPTDGYGLAPHGFLARTADGSVVAGAFADSFGGVPLSDGTHYLLVQRGDDEVRVRQPIGDDTDLGVAPPARWQPGQPLVATAYDVNGNALGTAPGTIRDGRFVFHWARAVGPGQTVVYRVAAG
jgi:hypothetical protein